MLLAGVGLPSAPLVLPAVTPVPPGDLAELRSALQEVIARLPTADCAVLVAPGAAGSGHRVHRSAHVDLSGLGRPDVVADVPVSARAARVLADQHLAAPAGGPLPLGLTVLALHLDRPALPVSVDPETSGDQLVDLGRTVSEALTAAGVRFVVAAAVDGSAGLGPRSPRPAAAGAEAWQQAFEASLGDPEALSALGPAPAQRAAALGWSSACMLAGMCAQQGLRLHVAARAAPRGVGYVIAEAR